MSEAPTIFVRTDEARSSRPTSPGKGPGEGTEAKRSHARSRKVAGNPHALMERGDGVNKAVGDDARKGAVKKRTQFKTRLGGVTAWTKRSKTSGEFMAVKSRREENDRQEVQGWAAAGETLAKRSDGSPMEATYSERQDERGRRKQRPQLRGGLRPRSLFT
jgi:hypothetical protein